MLPKAILLDMDDTIIAFDHGVDLDACWKKVCSKNLPGLDDKQIEAIIGSIKATAKWYWSDPERHRTGRLDLDKARTEIVSAALEQTIPIHGGKSSIIAVEYGLERDRAITLYPNAIETLKSLSILGIKLALITNGASPPQRNKIERFALAGYFDCIIIEGEFGAGKPELQVYQHALEQLGVRPEETWMVGDNFEWEIAAPQKMGIKGIWINPKGKEPHDSTIPFRTIASISDLLDLIEENS